MAPGNRIHTPSAWESDSDELTLVEPYGERPDKHTTPYGKSYLPIETRYEGYRISRESSSSNGSGKWSRFTRLSVDEKELRQMGQKQLEQTGHDAFFSFTRLTTDVQDAINQLIQEVEKKDGNPAAQWVTDCIRRVQTTRTSAWSGPKKITTGFNVVLKRTDRRVDRAVKGLDGRDLGRNGISSEQARYAKQNFPQIPYHKQQMPQIRIPKRQVSMPKALRQQQSMRQIRPPPRVHNYAAQDSSSEYDSDSDYVPQPANRPQQPNFGPAQRVPQQIPRPPAGLYNGPPLPTAPRPQAPGPAPYGTMPGSNVPRPPQGLSPFPAGPPGHMNPGQVPGVVGRPPFPAGPTGHMHPGQVPGIVGRPPFNVAQQQQQQQQQPMNNGPFPGVPMGAPPRPPVDNGPFPGVPMGPPVNAGNNGPFPGVPMGPPPGAIHINDFPGGRDVVDSNPFRPNAPFDRDLPHPILPTPRSTFNARKDFYLSHSRERSRDDHRSRAHSCSRSRSRSRHRKDSRSYSRDRSPRRDRHGRSRRSSHDRRRRSGSRQRSDSRQRSGSRNRSSRRQDAATVQQLKRVGAKMEAGLGHLVDKLEALAVNNDHFASDASSYGDSIFDRRSGYTSTPMTTPPDSPNLLRASGGRRLHRKTSRSGMRGAEIEPASRRGIQGETDYFTTRSRGLPAPMPPSRPRMQQQRPKVWPNDDYPHDPVGVPRYSSRGYDHGDYVRGRNDAWRAQERGRDMYYR